MAEYLSFEQYTIYGGTLGETDFNNLAFEATTQIDWYTFHRLDKFDTIPEAVQRCMFYLIQLLEEERNALIPGSVTDSSNSGVDRTIASQSNDGVSISYNILSASEVAEKSTSKIDAVIKKYLGNVTDSLGRRILYRGLYPDE